MNYTIKRTRKINIDDIDINTAMEIFVNRVCILVD